MSALRPIDEAFVADLRERATAPAKTAVAAAQLVRDAGITYRQLDYWTRTGRLQLLDLVAGRGDHERVAAPGGAGSGWSRRYPASEVTVATLMRRLLDAGLTLQPAHDAARAYAEHPDDLVPLGPGLALIITDDDEREPGQ